jgi:YegS/Rv2252/BmrU family lipid kinase
VYGFIVNKTSGNGKALRVWKKIEKIIQEKKVSFSVRFTQKPKHATSLVQELIQKEKAAVIIAVGGDGTIHEVVNGLAGTTTPLGIIPAGSGNDFSRGLGIPLKYDKALERILKGKPKTIDIGYANSRYFCTVAGIGFDGEVARTTNGSFYKKFLNFFRIGQISYVISAIIVLFRYKPQEISFMIDKKLHKLSNVWLIAVANLPYYGGGLVICPKAESNDGLFEICIVQGLTKWEFIRMFPRVYKGNHTSSPSITIVKGKEVEIYAPTPLLLHGDGEMLGHTPARIRIEPTALNVI